MYIYMRERLTIKKSIATVLTKKKLSGSQCQEKRVGTYISPMSVVLCYVVVVCLITFSVKVVYCLTFV